MGEIILLNDSLFNDKNFGKIDIDDVYVKYLEGDGNSYIETKFVGYRNNSSDISGMIPSDIPKIEVKFSLSDNASSLYNIIFGNGTGNTPTPLFITQGTNIRYMGRGAIFSDIPIKKETEYVVEIGSVYSYLNREQISDNTDMSNQYRINSMPNHFICLFAGQYTTSSGTNFTISKGVRIYYFKAFEGDKLVSDLRPYKKDGIGCMRDEITGEFFENKGTGSFITGSIAI